MPLSTDHSAIPGSPNGKGGGARIRRWNRKLHYYVGLYLLFFVWLFSFSGLLLNHPSWKFAEFWDSRRQSSEDYEIVLPPSSGDLSQARDLMRQLDIRGELEWTTTRKDTNRFDFRVSRPGLIYEVKADLARQKATVQQIQLNRWGVIRILHTFTGVRLDDSRNGRDWILTSVWAWAMDATAVGLVLMVLSSYFMWLELPQKRRLGAVALLLGLLSCGLFCFGLQWLS
jgi:uncharacterized protein